MGGELLFEGLDGAAISNKTLSFIIDMKKQSGNFGFDK